MLKNFIFLMVLLSSCSLPTSNQRIEILNEYNKSQFSAKIYKTNNFEIYSLNKIKNSGKLIVYIEGDGLSWIDRRTVSSDPTPIDPVAFRLAKIDQNDNVIYLARPCQYIQARNCNNNEIWTVSQYSETILRTYKLIIDSLSQFREIHIVGYSGGAGVAMYLAASNNKKIKSIRTIAGNINHDEFTELRNLTPPKDSINFNMIEKNIKNIGQIHYFGKNDKTIPKDLHLNFYMRNRDNSCIQIKEVKATHHKGWFSFWKKNHSEIPFC